MTPGEIPAKNLRPGARIVQPARRQPPSAKLVVLRLVSGFIVGILINVGIVYFFDEYRKPRQPLVATEFSKTFDALRANARQVGDLLDRLQAEAENRSRALQDLEAQLKELEQARRLLQLSEPDRKALQAMLARPPSFKDTLASFDFWLGRVGLSFAIGTFFFWLGGRRAKSSDDETVLKSQLFS